MKAVPCCVIFQMPEFVALVKRLGLNYDLPVKSFSLVMKEPDEYAQVTCEFSAVDLLQELSDANQAIVR